MFKAGVFWIGLASFRDSALVTESIARVLGAKDELAKHIADRELLLLLDNMEQVVEAASGLVTLLECCPNLKLLVTSRELLRVTGEVEYPVPPLAEPEAVELFCARSRLQPDETIAELCRRLDELPLGIELAAARTSVLSPFQILERLSQRLDLFKGGRDAEARQETLRATIEWSYDLLSEEEQRLFARLGVFRGGCTLEASEKVADADLDTLQLLVDKSLARHTNERFWLLETIREYARERLAASSEEVEFRRRHAEYFLKVAESANLSVEAIGKGAQQHEVVIADQHNVRAAIEWGIDADVELSLRLAVALENFWVTQDPAEGMRWFQALLDRSGGVDVKLRAQGWRDYGGCAEMAGQPEVSLRAHTESRELFDQAGDERGVVEADFRLGIAELSRGDRELGRQLCADSLRGFESLGDEVGVLQVLGDLGSFELEDGDPERGRELCERALRMARRIGWAWYEAYLLSVLGEAAFDAGRRDDGERQVREALAVARRIIDRRRTIFTLASLARMAAVNDDVERATTLWAAIEAEEAKGPIGRWAHVRDHYAAQIPNAPSPAQPLELDEAVKYALAEG